MPWVTHEQHLRLASFVIPGTINLSPQSLDLAYAEYVPAASRTVFEAKYVAAVGGVYSAACALTVSPWVSAPPAQHFCNLQYFVSGIDAREAGSPAACGGTAHGRGRRFHRRLRHAAVVPTPVGRGPPLCTQHQVQCAVCGCGPRVRAPTVPAVPPLLWRSETIRVVLDTRQPAMSKPLCWLDTVRVAVVCATVCACAGRQQPPHRRQRDAPVPR